MACQPIDRDGDTDGASTAQAARFDSTFQLSRTIEIDESTAVPITKITDVAVASDGRLAIADSKAVQVTVYDGNGVFLGSVGAKGDGPGEFRHPLAVTFDEKGELYVVDGTPPSLIRYAPDLAYDTTVRITDARVAVEAEVVGSDVWVLTYSDRIGDKLLRRYDRDGKLLDVLYELDPAIVTRPFWEAATDLLMAAGRAEVIVGYNLRYPLLRYDASGQLVDSVGVPPASWIPPPPSAPDEPHNTETLEKWLRTFTTIREIAVYRDAFLLISHQRLDPDNLEYRSGTYTADVYELGGEKIVEDVRLPGRLLTAGQFVYILLDREPDRTFIGAYTLRGTLSLRLSRAPRSPDRPGSPGR